MNIKINALPVETEVRKYRLALILILSMMVIYADA
jgi:hypothetical protein